MMGLIKQYKFAAIVAGVLAVMTVLVLGKTLWTTGAGGDARAAPSAEAKGPAGGGAPNVVAVAVGQHPFTDAIQALGTAQARESIVLTPKVADTIRALRFDSGDRVRQGQVLVEMSSVEQAADLAEARASNEAAQQDLRRYQELFNRGFASQARLDTVQAAADAAQARVNAGGSRISDRTIRAPFSGIVGLRLASPGQYVQPGDRIGTLDDVSSIKLDFDVPETTVARVAPRVAIVAHSAAYPNRTFAGVVDTVDSRVDPATRTVRVRAILPNGDGIIRPGMLMTVEVRSNPRQALAIPEMAILDQTDGAYAFRVNTRDGAQTVEQVKLETGQRADGMAEVLSGLGAGDLVVTEGVQSVRAGQNVRMTEAQAAPATNLRPRT